MLLVLHLASCSLCPLQHSEDKLFFPICLNISLMQKHFKDKPRKLATVLSECLKEEKKVLASVSEKQVKYDMSHSEGCISV